MDKLTAIKIKYKDGTYSDEIPVSVLAENVKWNNNNNLNLTEVLGNVKVTTAGTVQNQIDALANEKADVSDVTNLGTRVANVEIEISGIANGSPTPVATVAEMTDESAVYLYTGSETGYTAGNWYYYNGTAWTSGGQYGGAVTDTTLSISGKPADAKAVEDALADKADADDLMTVQTALAGKANSAEIGDLSQLTTTAKDNLVSAINEAAQTAETNAAASAQTATTKASEATASAQSAASSAQTATDKATLASQKAAAASESATLATAKASAAAISETNVAASAQTASAKASEAAASATSAQEYDESAQASAVNAQTAQGLAETAQTAAETAQGLAEDARDEAQSIVDEISAKSEQIDALDTRVTAVEGNVDDVNERLVPVEEVIPKENTIGSAVSIAHRPHNCYLKGATNSQYDATAVIDGVNIRVTSLNGQTETRNKFLIGSGQIDKAYGNLFIIDRMRTGSSSAGQYERAIGRDNSSAIELVLFKTRCDYSIDAVNAYLNENPIRIWYQTPNYATAEKFCEYIICTGTKNYAVIGTVGTLDPLTETDHIDFRKGVIVSGATEEPIALSGDINDIPDNVTITGSGTIEVVELVNLADAFVKDGWNEIIPKNTSFFDNINYFGPSEASFVTGLFANTNGVIVSSDASLLVSSLIMPVKPNTQYILYVPENNRGIIVGNTTNRFVAGQMYTILYSAGVARNGYLFTTGNTDRYIFAYIYNGTYDYDSNKDDICLYEGNTLPQYRKPVVKKENLPQDIFTAISPLEGAKVLVFGDSITDTCNFTINAADQTTAVTWKNPSNSYVDAGGNTITFNMWPKILKDMGVCAEIRNYARSGASYQDAQRTSGEERQNLSYQITVALNDLANPNDVFIVDDFVPDIVIFALGTNDGEPDDTYADAMAKTVLKSDGYSIDTTATLANLDMSKFCESARSAFLRTRVAFPYAQFFCVLPIQRANNETNGEDLNADLRHMARRYGCIVIDGFSESGIIRDTNVWNTIGDTLKDGLHPNDKGQDMMFRMIYTALKTHYIHVDQMNN